MSVKISDDAASAPDAPSRSPFERFDDADVQALISEYPLAWVIAHGDGGEASLLPLIGVYDETGRLTEFIGHLARANPLYAALSADPRATVLLRGPEAYISPEYAGLLDWGPTWNYAQLIVRGDVVFDAAQTEDALNVLLDAMEQARAEPWTSAALGGRYSGMLNAIIGFRMRVVDVRGKFKLSQDERPEVLRSIVANVPDPGMQRWIRRFNEGRL